MNIINIEKYNRVIKKSRMSRLTSVHELFLIHAYNKLLSKWDQDTIDEVANSLRGSKFLEDRNKIVFYYYNKPSDVPTQVELVFEADSGDINKVKTSFNQEFDNSRAIDQYICSQTGSPGHILSPLCKKTLEELNKVEKIEVENIPREILVKAQEFIRPASIGLDLKPIYKDVRDISTVKGSVDIVRHLLMAIYQRKDILIFENININVQESKENDIIDLLSLCSSHISIFYTKQKRRI